MCILELLQPLLNGALRTHTKTRTKLNQRHSCCSSSQASTIGKQTRTQATCFVSISQLLNVKLAGVLFVWHFFLQLLKAAGRKWRQRLENYLLCEKYSRLQSRVVESCREKALNVASITMESELTELSLTWFKKKTLIFGRFPTKWDLACLIPVYVKSIGFGTWIHVSLFKQWEVNPLTVKWVGRQSRRRKR